MKTLVLKIKDGLQLALEMNKPCRRQMIAVNKLMAEAGVDYYNYQKLQIAIFNKMQLLGLKSEKDFKPDNENVSVAMNSDEFQEFNDLRKKLYVSDLSLDLVRHIWIEKGGRYLTTLDKYGDAISDYYGDNPEADLEGDLDYFFASMQLDTKAAKGKPKAKNTTPPKE